MRARREKGFTIAEILVAVVVLSVGVMALVGSSALATRMIGRGGKSTEVVQLYTARSEWLRALAAGTSPECTNAKFKSDSALTNGVVEKWVVPANGDTRAVRLSFRYRTPAGVRTDTMTITLYCR